MVDTVRVPLAAVEEVVVRQVLAVRVGDKRYTSPAVGRSRRSLGREGVQTGDDAVSRAADQAFGLFVQERIRERAKDERRRLGIADRLRRAGRPRRAGAPGAGRAGDRLAGGLGGPARRPPALL